MLTKQIYTNKALVS